MPGKDGTKDRFVTWMGIAAAFALAIILSSALSAGAITRVTVSGYVKAGPTCPVSRASGTCVPAPVNGTVVARNSNDEAVAKAHTASDGRYAFRIAPGRYLFAVSTTKPFPRCPVTSVDVKAVPSKRVNIMCDTGIRLPN